MPQIDAGYFAQVHMDSAHHLIHEGEFYVTHHYQEAVPDDEAFDILIEPCDKHVHIQTVTSVEQATIVGMYRNPAPALGSPIGSPIGSPFTDEYGSPLPGSPPGEFTGGIELPVYNRNETSTKTAGCRFRYNANVANRGTVLVRSFLPAGTQGKAVGFTSSQTDEFVLNKDRTYLLCVRNVSGGASNIGVVIKFYEAPIDSFPGSGYHSTK